MSEPVIDLLAEEWRRIDELCSTLDEQDWSRTTDCPGWTVKDQLAHVIGTESMLAGHPRPPALAPDQRPSHVRNDMGALNEAWVEAMRHQSPSEVLDRFRQVTAERVEQLRAFPSERFDEVGPTPVGQAPYREFMNVRVMDCWVHEQDIRRAVGRPGHHDGPVAAHAVERFVSAMPFVVGKKAGAADGATVLFDLRGGPRGGVAVAVDAGRAKVVSELPDRPTVRLSMEAETWWCLALGRLSAEEARRAGLVEIEGDAELGGRILENLNFMI